MIEPILWVALGALAVQTTLFYVKELHPAHFWVLTLFNWLCLFALPYAIHAAYLRVGCEPAVGTRWNRRWYWCFLRVTDGGLRDHLDVCGRGVCDSHAPWLIGRLTM